MADISRLKNIVELLEKFPCFVIVDNKIFCKLCSKLFVYRPNDGVAPLKQHTMTKLHTKKVLSEKNSQENIDGYAINVTKVKDFDTKLVNAFASANIPLDRLNNSMFKKFLEEFSKMEIKSVTHYRKLIEEQHASKFEQECKGFAASEIYLMFDETTDSVGRYMLNILIGKLSDKSRMKPKLMKTIELSKTNSVNINTSILDLLTTIYGTLEKAKLTLLLSDAAPYAVKTGKMLKQIFPNLKHVTCIIHLLHRICEKIRDISPKVNELTSNFKKLLIKNHENQSFFKESTNLKMPKFPIITRWGSWLNFSIYLSVNYNKICKFYSYLVEKRGNKYKRDLDLIKSETFISELKLIKKHEIIIQSITKLESDTISTEEQIIIFKEAISVIDEEIIKIKLNCLMEKNPDLHFFIKYDSMRAVENDKKYAYVPLTTAAVERSFSNLKFILDDKRKSLTVENIERMLFLYFNVSGVN